MSQQSPPPLPPELLRALEAFNNRKKYADFDVATLRAIKDEDLETAILDYIFARLDEQPKQRYQRLLGLSRGFQVVYLCWQVEAEVMNGGFNQYFWNSSSEFAELAPQAMLEIGDPVAAGIVQQALDTAIAEIPTMRKYRKQGSPQAFSDSYKETQLTSLDAPFEKRAANFRALFIRYIREHEQLFVTR